MGPERTKELLTALEKLLVFGGFVAVLLLVGAFFFAASGLPTTPQTEGFAWRSFVMAITSNLIPIFLIFVSSYFLLRHVQRIKASEDRDDLVAAIRAANEGRGPVSQSVIHGFERFSDDAPWKTLIEGSSNIRIVVHYFDTWIDRNEAALETFFNHGGRIELVLPDYDNGEVLEAIKTRFPDQTKAVLEKKIQNTYEKLKKIQAASSHRRASVEASYVKPAPLYCAVVFDQRELVLSPYEHNRGVAVGSPAVMYSLGAFPTTRKWIDEEFSYLVSQRVKVKTTTGAG